LETLDHGDLDSKDKSSADEETKEIDPVQAYLTMM